MCIKCFFAHEVTSQQSYNKSLKDSNIVLGFPGAIVVKNPPANARDEIDVSLIPGPGRSSGIENGNPLQYSCLENSMDRGAWWATVHGAEKNQTQLSD